MLWTKLEKLIVISINKSKKAFTLAEILVVVLIIALFTVASGGYFVKTYRAVMFKNNVKDIVTTIRFARLWSIENQQSCVFSYDVVNQKMMIVTSDIDNGQQILKNQYVKEIKLSKQTQLTRFVIDAVENEGSGESANQGLTFYPDGSCNQTLIELTNGKEFFTLVITAATGNIKLYQGEFEELGIKAKSVDLDLQSDQDDSLEY